MSSNDLWVNTHFDEMGTREVARRIWTGAMSVGVDGPAAPRAKVWLSIPNLKDRPDEP